jgi:hypothetical protein
MLGVTATVYISGIGLSMVGGIELSIKQNEIRQNNPCVALPINGNVYYSRFRLSQVFTMNG